ncbi:MAG TPA: N-acetylmuramoyl-L-alanine amidase, partial [Symbiobacteriaceae bacterium]|nr:N-acetylmuramoyl-L-alanine amidase [Symbiobacteriaceae bacterium]
MSYQGTAIMGRATARTDQMESVTRRQNPNAPELAGLYLTLGAQLGVRGDLAYAQALLETDFFRYGGLVQPEQNNYAGLGATGPGQPGHTFATPEEGVLAHLQHLYAYASTAPLPAGMRLVDPRFDQVERGIAPAVGGLNGRWAVPGNDYGQMIDRILGAILMEPTAAEPYAVTNAYLSTSSKNRPGPCSSSGCWQGVQGIVVHRTASPSQNARAIRNYFNDSPDGRFASSQFVLDDAEILQLMPIGEVAYHTAGANFTHLGIETCEHNWGTPAWDETYRKLVWLTAYLARSYNLPIGAVKGHFAFDPVNRPYDPTHIGWTPAEGKARGLFVWEEFLAAVEAE